MMIAVELKNHKDLTAVYKANNIFQEMSKSFLKQNIC